MTNGKFVKGQIPWNKGKKCPTISNAINKEQRSLTLKERWLNDEEYAIKAKNALDNQRHNPRSEHHKNKSSESQKLRLASHPENCECPMHRHYQTPEGVENMAQFFRGRKLTEDHKLKIFNTLNSHPVDCKCGWHNLAHIETRLETILYKLLKEFPVVIKKKHFGYKCVDAYLPEPYHLAFEADGEKWHQDKEYDTNRDAYLFLKFNLPVIRFSEKELLKIEKFLS